MTPLYEKVIPKKLYTVDFYPDPHPEVTSVDGTVSRVRENYDSWAQIRDGAGNGAVDDDTNLFIRVDGAAIGHDGMYDYINRAILLFDTSSIPAMATIVSATLMVYGTSSEQRNITGITLNVFSSNPANNTVLVPADYGTLGTIPLATAIAFADFDAAGWNTFTLNAAGRAAIKKAGITKLGLREATYDAPDNEPTWIADIHASFMVATSEVAAQKPKLTVTYRA